MPNLFGPWEVQKLKFRICENLFKLWTWILRELKKQSVRTWISSESYFKLFWKNLSAYISLKSLFFFFFFFCKVHFFAHKASFSLIPYYIQKSVLQSYLCNGNQDLKAFIIIIIIITIIINTIIIIITGLFIVYNLKKLLR